jgi:phenylalanyl-tRNA synthetase beta chain
MKFTYNWLKRFLDTTLSAEQISEELTNIGLELEDMVDRSKDLSDFKVAFIENAEQHPNADKLKICNVFDGRDYHKIVCGATNARAGIKVVLASAGTVIPNGEFKIKQTKIRDVESNGMLCSFDELLIDSEDSGGIIELPEDAVIGDKILKYLGLDDVMYEVSVTPNRGDWLGVYSIARDLAAKNLGKLIKLEQANFNESFTSDISVEVSSESCSLVAFREIRGLKNSQTPLWMKNLFKNIGMVQLSLPVDITNYFSVSFGRPMHAYDKAKIGKKIKAKNLEKEEIFSALNDKEYKLSVGDLVILDENKVLSLAGVIGSSASKCDETTEDILLECAVFDKIAVTKLGRKYSIITDSRSRFERGIDDDATEFYLNYASGIISEITGAKISEVVKAGNLKNNNEAISFDYTILKTRIGLDVSLDESKHILQSLGFEIVNEKSNILEVKIPSWRHDVSCPEVLAEEIARISGFENIVPKEISASNELSRISSDDQKRKNILSRAAAILGYNEAISYSFMNAETSKLFAELEDKMKLVNPITTDFNYMRPSIIPNLILSLKSNMARSISDVSIFELGPIFSSKLNQFEEFSLTAISSGKAIRKSHIAQERKVDIFDLKFDLEYLLSELGFSFDKLQLDSNLAPKYYHPGRSAALKLGKTEIAYFGEIHPKILWDLDIKNNVCGFEIFIDRIPVSRSKFGRRADVKFSPYQKISRDFAFLVDKDLEAGNLLKQIKSIDELVVDAEIFDIYFAKNMGAKKSIAINVLMQHMDKTLTDAEIDNVSEKIIAMVKDKFDGDLRSAK